MSPHADVLSLDGEYWKIKEVIVNEEQRLLRILRFDVEVEQVYPFMLTYVHSMFHDDDDRCVPITRLAWRIATDSLQDPAICISEPAPLIAIASIYCAAKMLQQSHYLPVGPKPFWEVFGFLPIDVERVGLKLVALYSRLGARGRKTGSLTSSSKSSSTTVADSQQK